MCGIYGSIGILPDAARIDLVAHRGPDGRGWQEFSSSNGPVCLGHRRLAIIGLDETGAQPMTDATGRWHIVFNGEIYNYKELRAELEKTGESFRTATDTEVLLRALVVWGPEAALPRLRGMFAFLLWDAKEQCLLAARDRFGIKPLYFVRTAEGGLAFGSEIKQLIGLPGVPARLNLARVHDFLLWGIADHTAETMFYGVRQLRGGEALMVRATSTGPAQTQLHRWYPLCSANPKLNLDEAEAAERFRELLQTSMRLHLRSDVPVGSCLSGGLDSSSIVCLMARELGVQGSPRTVSACFPEKSVDERPYMEAVVAATGSVPHWVFPRPEDVFEKASEITWFQDEPYGGTSIHAQWDVFQAARQAGIKVMLDGQGADEQLAGYHSGYGLHLATLLRQGHFGQLAQIMGDRARSGVPLGGQLARMGAYLLPARLAKSLRRRRVMGADWLATDAFRPFANAPSPQDLAIGELGLPPVTDVATWCLAMTHASNLPMLLHWEDRNSMAHSIEARVPFLDHSLVEFSLALENAHKFVGADTKRVLRRAMANILPPLVRDRRDKLGFATPEAEWLRGSLREVARGAVEDTLRLWPGLIAPGPARLLLSRVLEGQEPAGPALWRVMCLGIWGQRFGVSV
jgi:asparagine synthase (glutamine-hydrolysing)